MRTVLALFLPLCLSGCLATTYVSSIGAREEKGELSLVAGEPLAEGSLQEYKRRISAGHIQLLVPYKTLRAGDPIGAPLPASISVAEIHDSPDGRTKLARVNGKLFSLGSNVIVGDDANSFPVEQSLYASRTYRTWWGYPSQGLQLVAFPIDAVLCPLFFISVGAVSLVSD